MAVFWSVHKFQNLEVTNFNNFISKKIGRAEFKSGDKQKTGKIFNLLNMSLVRVFHVLKGFQITSIPYAEDMEVHFYVLQLTYCI